jgi:hypothetical protein
MLSWLSKQLDFITARASQTGQTHKERLRSSIGEHSWLHSTTKLFMQQSEALEPFGF